MFEKIDVIVDRILEKKWVQVFMFTALILNAFLAVVGAVFLSMMFG